MKYLLFLLTCCCINQIINAQHTEIEHSSQANDPHLELKQTNLLDQYARIWFTNDIQPSHLWSMRAGSDAASNTDLDFRFSDGNTVQSILKLDATEEEAIFSTDILADGKGIFHRTDNLTQFLDLITSGANADTKLRMGSGGSVSSTIGWDPGDKALKLIPDAFSFTNGGLIIKDADPGVRYGFNTAPNDDDRISVAFNPSGVTQSHINLIATGTGDLARMKFSESTGFTTHSFNLAGGLDGSDPRFYISYSDGAVATRLITIKGDDKSLNINNTIDLNGESGFKGGIIDVRDSIGGNKVRIFATPNATNQGGWITMFNQNNERTVLLNADDPDNAGVIALYNADGNNKLQLDANWGGTGLSRVVTDELELNGGSDFAEHFDVQSNKNIAISAGYVVSINPDQPGQLKLSNGTYDTKVAGIISGANGVRPGIMMGQEGSIADGEYPIALSGRVYVHANTENGLIAPGDLLTTSTQPGIAMRATDKAKSFGAIIGKAMTPIDDNGFVLVLVNLQ